VLVRQFCLRLTGNIQRKMMNSTATSEPRIGLDYLKGIVLRMTNPIKEFENRIDN
jgi:hypothetical protein